MRDRDGHRLQLVGQLGELVAAGHLTGELVEGHLAALLVEDRLAELEDDEVVPDQVGVVRVVGDEHDAEPGVAGRGGVLQHDTGLLDAQRCRGLVEDQHPRTEVHRARDGDTLALTTGELTDGLVDVLDHDAHLAQLLVGDALHLLDLQAGQAGCGWRSARSRGRSCATPPSARRRRGPGRPWRCRGPAPRAGRRSCTSVPSTVSVPSLCGCRPEMILIRVDFPAPLSPSTQVTSPARTVRLMPLRARIAP